MCHTGATHSGTKRQSRRNPVAPPADDFSSFSAGDAGTAVLDGPPPVEDRASGGTKEDHRQQQDDSARHSGTMEQARVSPDKTTGKARGGSEQPAITDSPSTSGKATGGKRRGGKGGDKDREETGKEDTDKTKVKSKTKTKAKSKTKTKAKAKDSTGQAAAKKKSSAKAESPQEPVAEKTEQVDDRPAQQPVQPYVPPETKERKAKKPEDTGPKPPPPDAITRDQAFVGAADKKIVNLSSPKAKSVAAEQEPKQKEAAVVLKTVKFILDAAAKDEQRYFQGNRSYEGEIPGRLGRLHSVLFQSQAASSDTHGGGQPALKRKIMTEIQRLAGDGFSQIKLPKFLQGVV